MIIKNTSVPVIVLSTNGTQCLGITRSLGKLGVQVHVIQSNTWMPSFFSKYCKNKYICNRELPSEAVIKYLLNIASKIGEKSILIPCSDELVNTIVDNRGLLGEFYILPLISPELVKSLISKKEMFFVAKKYGIPTPRTYFPPSRGDLVKYIDQIRFPLMLKGIYG